MDCIEPLQQHHDTMPPLQQPPVASRPPARQLDANQIRLLEQQGFTTGLIQAVSYYINTIPLRIWVLDNSASMQVRDGHRITGSTFQNLTSSDCSRWEEAQDEVAFHAYMSGALGVPTRFNMVNTPASATAGVQLPSSFSVAENGPAAVQQELQMAKQIMGQVIPTGPATPLDFHLGQIRSMVLQMAPQLAREGKSVSLILATSGVPTDAHGQHGPAVVQDFVNALRSLEGLPISIVVRLCTDDEKVVDFYNTLDAITSNTSLVYDVVDDFYGEALEIYLKNPWLNAALPLHRFRQMGFSVPVLDELDEHALSYAELHKFCAFLFPAPQPWPDPAVDWANFLRFLAMVLAREKMHHNPITRSLGPWIDLRLLHFVYGRNTPFPPHIPVPMAPAQHFYQQLPQQQYPGHPSQQQTGNLQWQQPRQRNSFEQDQEGPESQHRNSFPQQQPQQRNSFHQPETSQTQPPPHQQAPPQPSQSTPLDASVSANKYAQQVTADETMTQIKHFIIRWATAPPGHQHLRSIDQLLGTVPQILPPAFGLADHAYFKTWKPFALEALAGRDEAVLKRAVRKTKFFLHPDKLPKDLTNEQSFVCRMLWDIVADAWEAFGGH